ncbi:MAG: acyltransferase [Paludibacteraceae bacterium]|nr:acyltransferase [Paludibacteraceae bacterium]
MSKFTKHIWRAFGKVFYPHFHNDVFINSTILKYIFWQKICGINRSTPWPVHFTSKVIAPELIDNNSGMRAPGYAMGCYIDGRNRIIIEQGVIVGPKVSIISKNHNTEDYNQYSNDSPIILHKHCWLACGSTVLAGVELGEHTIVAAGAVVTKSFLQGNCILAGCPAKIIKTIPPYSGNGQV